MVKGISKQVILVRSPDPKLFEQAIFILKDDADSVSEEDLLREANRLMDSRRQNRGREVLHWGILWALAGAFSTGIVWLMTVLV